MKQPLISFVVLVLVLFAAADGTHRRARNPYPNELQGFKFYDKYLAPLRPGVSDHKTVGRVLGDTGAVKRDGWTIVPIFTVEGGPIHNPTLGSLAEIVMRPDKTMPMGAVQFPSDFDHCHASISEMNISFDVYSDTSGLEYWLHEEDSQWGKKADLYRVVYAPRSVHTRPTRFADTLPAPVRA